MVYGICNTKPKKLPLFFKCPYGIKYHWNLKITDSGGGERIVRVQVHESFINWFTKPTECLIYVRFC